MIEHMKMVLKSKEVIYGVRQSPAFQAVCIANAARNKYNMVTGEQKLWKHTSPEALTNRTLESLWTKVSIP